MADTKISALTAATTPLAGTEVLPVVQSGVTKKVSVADLTAGRAVSMASATVTGDLVFSTSGKGIDFNATSHAAGMTSELLNDYEEGTWTPTITAATGSGYTTAAYFGRYTKIGRVVTVSANIQITAAGTAAGVMTISGLPYAAAANMNFSGSVYESVSGVLYATHVNGGASTATVTTTAGLGVVWAYATQYYVTFVYEI